MFQRPSALVRPVARLIVLLFVAATTLMATATVFERRAEARSIGEACALGSDGRHVDHVVYIQFNNVHLKRDNPNVPSDLEQMPTLLQFMQSQGTLLTNHHTPLIAHTGTDILSTLTGVYGDRNGVPVANTFRFYTPDGASHAALSFAYWTDRVVGFDGTTSEKPLVMTAQGTNAPAPWVPFTRAGCNFGAIGLDNTVLERVSNIANFFGPGSPEAAEAKADPAQATADFVGIAIHCAAGAALCSGDHGVLDPLPAEPGGYSGFKGLFGHKYVAPQIGTGGVVRDIEGNAIAGFPGFSAMTAARTLGYTAAMLEHGVPVTFAYLTDAHENLETGIELGPGDPTYEANLRAYDRAFADFFARLTRDGITPANTLFVIGADENDHFVGAPPLNPGCDGVTVACQYDPNKLGQIEVDVQFLLAQQGINTPFDVRDDSAPNFYLVGDPRQPSNPDTRLLERALGSLQVTNPLTGRTERITQGMADRTEMKLLHMVTADESRTPTFTIFANPDYHVQAGPPDCSADPPETPVCEFSGGDVWSHGDLAPDINTTWFSFTGPGVRHLGRTDSIWSDHPDVRPTFLTLLGLRDTYPHQGRVLIEMLAENAVPRALRAHEDTLLRLGQLYKQINAPVGALGLASVKISTRGLESGGASDQVFTRTQASLSALTTSRDSLASDIEGLLEGAEFAGKQPDEDRVANLIDRAEQLLEQVSEIAED
jgi:hypothetical protein